MISDNNDERSICTNTLAELGIPSSRRARALCTTLFYPSTNNYRCLCDGLLIVKCSVGQLVYTIIFWPSTGLLCHGGGGDARL